MGQYLKVITAPTFEPVSLEEAKDQCRIDTSDTGQDALILGYMSAARDYVEWRTGRTINQTTLELVLDCFPADRVLFLTGATPLIEIESVTYTDSVGVDHDWDSSHYVLSLGSASRTARIAPAFSQTWPVFVESPLDAVKVRYKAGTADSPLTEADSSIKLCVLMLVAGMFENRESEVIPERSVIQTISLRYGVEAILSRLQVEYAF